MKNVQVIISFIPVNGKKKKCSIVVSKNSLENIEKKLEWGGEYNDVISSLTAEYNGLHNWYVTTVQSTLDEEVNLNPVIITKKKTEKPEKKKTEKKSDDRIIADFLLKNINCENITELVDKIDDVYIKLELIKEINKQWRDSVGLSEEEVEWASKNLKKSYFKPTIAEIKKGYADSISKTKEEKIENAEKYSKPIKYKYGTDLSGTYIRVGEYGIVDYKHFERYIRHLQAPCISGFAQEYEYIRCKLHNVIFNSLGGDRIKDRTELGRAIDDIVSSVLQTCICGGILDFNNQCEKCETYFKPEHAFINLKNLVL